MGFLCQFFFYPLKSYKITKNKNLVGSSHGGGWMVDTHHRHATGLRCCHTTLQPTLALAQRHTAPFTLQAQAQPALALAWGTPGRPRGCSTPTAAELPDDWWQAAPEHVGLGLHGSAWTQPAPPWPRIRGEAAEASHLLPRVRPRQYCCAPDAPRPDCFFRR